MEFVIEPRLVKVEEEVDATMSIFILIIKPFLSFFIIGAIFSETMCPSVVGSMPSINNVDLYLPIY